MTLLAFALALFPAASLGATPAALPSQSNVCNLTNPAVAPSILCKSGPAGLKGQVGNSKGGGGQVSAPVVTSAYAPAGTAQEIVITGSNLAPNVLVASTPAHWYYAGTLEMTLSADGTSIHIQDPNLGGTVSYLMFYNADWSVSTFVDVPDFNVNPYFASVEPYGSGVKIVGEGMEKFRYLGVGYYDATGTFQRVIFGSPTKLGYSLPYQTMDFSADNTTILFSDSVQLLPGARVTEVAGYNNSGNVLAYLILPVPFVL